jgi:hypothetical protein
MNVQRVVWILWPSFIVGGVATAVFFTLFDPNELALFGANLGASRLAVYSIGFFVFWLLAAASSAMTCFFQRSSADINRGGRGRAPDVDAADRS